MDAITIVIIMVCNIWLVDWLITNTVWYKLANLLVFCILIEAIALFIILWKGIV